MGDFGRSLVLVTVTGVLAPPPFHLLHFSFSRVLTSLYQRHLNNLQAPAFRHRNCWKDFFSCLGAFGFVFVRVFWRGFLHLQRQFCFVLFFFAPTAKSGECYYFQSVSVCVGDSQPSCAIQQTELPQIHSHLRSRD